MLRVGKAICHKCGDPAKFYQGKWWCGYKSGMGTYNLVGYCKKEEKKGRNETDSNT